MDSVHSNVTGSLKGTGLLCVDRVFSCGWKFTCSGSAMVYELLIVDRRGSNLKLYVFLHYMLLARRRVLLRDSRR